MIMKYHNHTLQTKPRHREEEPQSQEISREINKATSYLFLVKMIGQLKWHEVVHKKTGQTQTPHKHWEEQ